MSSSELSSQNSYPYDAFLSHNRAQKDWTRDLAGAKEHFQRALDIWERHLGADHPSTQTARRNLQILLESGAPRAPVQQSEPAFVWF